MTATAHRFAGCLLLHFLLGCDAQPMRATPTPEAGTSGRKDAGDGGPSAVNLAALSGRSLDSLSSAEATAVCEEEARRTDPCIDIGLSWKTPAACVAATARCHAELDGSSARAACADAPGARADTCPFNVGDYLGCVDAWNALQQCSLAGRQITTPEACQGLVTTCSRFAGQFYRDGLPPACPDSGPFAPPDTGDDIYGFDGCRPVPARFVVLGDSIATCFNSPACAPNLIQEHLRDTVSPGITFESRAVAGSVTADLPGQAAQITGGPGHVLVWVYAIGNDLLAGNTDLAGLNQSWSQVFDYFTDRNRFPDGATILVNTQYDPYDDCDPEGPLKGSTPAQVAQLLSINKALFLDVAEQRSDTVAIDQYPDFLGHGDNANIAGCHCGSDNTAWLADIHPNELGNQHIADKWNVALDRMYGPACRDH